MTTLQRCMPGLKMVTPLKVNTVLETDQAQPLGWGRDPVPSIVGGALFLQSLLCSVLEIFTYIPELCQPQLQLWLLPLIVNSRNLKLNLHRWTSFLLSNLTYRIGVDLHKKEKFQLKKRHQLMKWWQSQKPNLWMKIGKDQCKKLLMTQPGPKLPVRPLEPTPLPWFKGWANVNMTALFRFYVPRILLRQKKLLATWHLSLLNLERCPTPKLKTPIPSKSQMPWAMLCSSPHISGWGLHSRTMTPMCTIFYMAPQTKGHHWSLLKSWFDQEISLCTRTWQNVDTHHTDFILQEKLLQKPASFHTALRSSPGRFWRLEKALCQSSLVGSTLDEILTSTRCQEAMKKSNVFVENMGWLEEKKSTRWQGLNTPQCVEWCSPTWTLLTLLDPLLDLGNIVPLGESTAISLYEKILPHFRDIPKRHGMPTTVARRYGTFVDLQ